MPAHEIRFEQAVNYDDGLLRAASESGVDTRYWDIFGHEHHVTREALQVIMESLGWATGSFESLEEARQKQYAKRLGDGVPETSVISQNEKCIELSLPSDQSSSICCEINLESGDALRITAEASQLEEVQAVVLDGRRWSVFRLDLPAEVPLGYHTVTVTVNEEAPKHGHVIVCPDRMYLPPNLAGGGRTAGFNIALYGVRSERNWGCGDFHDLRVLISWAKREVGFSFIGLNPLHALHNRTPYNTSPYLPLSMYYKNLIYIDVEGVPEFKACAAARNLVEASRFRAQIDELRSSEFVEYEKVDRLKRRFLKLLYRQFRRLPPNDLRARSFAEYCEREGKLLDRFALYSALDEALHKQNRKLWTWRDWPQQFQRPESPESRSFASDHRRLVEFYKYIQFVIEEQLTATQEHAKQAGMAIGLYHDLAVATDSSGSDLWSARDHYVEGCRVGAPPDDFSPHGQDWGFPPPNKEMHKREGYALYRESIRKIVRHGGALRIDHVMRLYRLFWIPGGMEPARGAYVRDYAEDLMRVLALESVRSQNIVIGEDLGTVTDEMRALFTRFGILSYRLFPFEKNYTTGEFKHSFEYPRQALVSSSTHDLPTLAGFWESADVEARRRVGLADDTGYANQIEDRRREKQRMLDLLHAENLLPQSYARDASSVNHLDGELHNAVIGFLAQSPSVLLLLNQEDFTKEPHQQNLPGSTAEYPNWRRKMRLTVDELGSVEAKNYSRMFEYHLSRTGRKS